MGYYHLSLFFLIVTACIVQQFVPSLSSLYDAKILLVPLVFLCAVVTVDTAVSYTHLTLPTIYSV